MKGILLSLGLYDANWIVDSEESKSTSGYGFTLTCGFVVGRFPNKHIAQFIMESESIALDKA